MLSIRRATCLVGAQFLALLAAGDLQAASIPKPAGARSWIIVSSTDCDDDGAGTQDRTHCAADITDLDQPGDIGHDILANNHQILTDATIRAARMEAFVQSAPSYSGRAWLDMSMLDTYTLNSNTLPPGTVVPLTVAFHGVATLQPLPYNNLAGFWGGGVFEVRIGNFFSDSPIVIPENSRVSSPFGSAANKSASITLAPSSVPIVWDLTATATFDVAVGTPFDLAYYAAARPAAASLTFNADIEFALPGDASITSTGGFGVTAGVLGLASPPPTLALGAANPSPFSRGTSLDLAMAAPGPLRVDVFRVDGRRVRTLVDESVPAGTRVVRWDGRDDAGAELPSGLYLVRGVTRSESVTRRVLLKK